MKYQVFSIRDKMVGFGQLMIENNVDTAKRNFAFALRNGLMDFAAGDYDLYKIGEYDLASGEFIQDGLPEFVISGADAKKIYM